MSGSRSLDAFSLLSRRRCDSTEHEAQRVPPASENARGLHVLQRDHGNVAERLVIQIELEGADPLAGVDGREQRLHALDACLELLPEPPGHGEVEVGDESRLYTVVGALVDR